MRRVKSRTRPDTPSETRLRQVAVGLGVGKELPVAWVADKAQVKRSTLKNAAARDSLSYDIARAIARLMVGDEAKLVAWLMGESAEAPKATEFAPRLPQDEPQDVERLMMPPSDLHGPGVVSESVRGYEQQEAVWRGFRVLANRIARTIQQTIAGNELGYSVTSRAMLADALEVFARDLDRRCGEKVCGDIWEMVAWLRKPSES